MCASQGRSTPMCGAETPVDVSARARPVRGELGTRPHAEGRYRPRVRLNSSCHSVASVAARASCLGDS